MGEFTELVNRSAEGDRNATEQVYEIIGEELTKMANGYMAKERRNHTLEPHALVNELFLRFAATEGTQWQSRQHFFSCAANTMRRVLVDHARKRNAARRGGSLKITKESLKALKQENMPNEIILGLENLIDLPFNNKDALVNTVKNVIGTEQTAKFEAVILKHVKSGSAVMMAINENLDGIPTQGLDILALHDALNELETFAPQQSQIVELRFFAGRTIEQVAEMMNILPKTVKHQWKLACAWLLLKLS